MSTTPLSSAVRAGFAGHVDLRAVLDGALEGRLGRVRPSPSEGAARADVGCYSFFGGDPGDPGAVELLRGIDRPRELVFGGSGGWSQLARRCFPDEIAPRPMRWFRGDALSRAPLERFAAELPDSYALRAFDEPLARELGPPLRPHALQAWSDAGSFVAGGFGFGVIRGDALACAATSYVLCSHGVEIAISTHPDHRRRGLARAAAARMCLESLDRDLEPHWNASNPHSQQLAIQLGFVPDREVAIDYVGAVDGGD